jgi:hypothetical protein
MRAKQAAEKLMLCIWARLYRLQKNSCFVSGHDFTACEKLTLGRPDFSRAVPAPDFQSGGAGFQTRENALSGNDGL